ncbi:MAG: sulfotransferase family 2 domain-containing protein [Desulfobulbus sp.]|nr:sulfotransferase family 2 domain-containing protein [Desulfobulbus sp.]
MQNEQIIFLHIPKTAGTTLRDIIHKQYGSSQIISIYPATEHIKLEDFKKLTPEQKNQPDIFIGHYGYGVHQWLTGDRPFRYATMLRHPIDRCLSLYNQLKNITYSGDDITFRDILNTPLKRQFQNLQTHFIAGGGPNNMLRRAIHRINEEFLFVGISERFNESLLLACHDLRWSLRPYERLNITSTEWPTNYADELRGDRRAMLKLVEMNSIDLQLYAYANNLFTQKLQATYPDAQEQIHRFETLLKNDAQKSLPWYRRPFTVTP